MAKEFKIVHESEIEGTPQQVFDAATVGNSGWLWPLGGEFEPRTGGTGPMGSTVTLWEPPHRFSNQMAGEGDFFNQLDYDISELPDGNSWLRYVHSG